MDWRNLQVFEGDMPYLMLDRLRHGGAGATIACDIETGGPDRAALLNWHMGHIETFTLYAPTSQILALVRVGEKKMPGWLSALMWDRTIKKIFHYAPFDLSFITHQWQVQAENIVCTKIAARLAGYPRESQGLYTLCREALGVTLDKREALSNWKAPRLSESQLQHAAQSVLYLPALYDLLLVEVARKGILAQYDAACQWLPARAWLQTHGHRPDKLFDYDYGE